MVYMRIYICVEVAENMMEAVEQNFFISLNDSHYTGLLFWFQSDDIEKTIYASKWYDQSSAEIILKVIIMRRCQKLPRIHVKGLMNTLNRNYLRKVVEKKSMKFIFVLKCYDYYCFVDNMCNVFLLYDHTTND